MANIKEIFDSAKLNISKIVGEDKFFKSEKEIEEFNKKQEKFLSNVDYSDPANFAKFGLAEEYYKTAIQYVNAEYPFDKSKAEKLEWINNLNDFEYYLFNNQYPRYSGFLNLTSSQSLKVSPPTNVLTSSAFSSFANISSSFFSNADLDFQSGISYEFWVKFDNFDNDCSLLKINHVTSSGGNLGNSELFNIKLSKADKKFYFTSGSNSGAAINLNTTASSGVWTHYAFNFNTSSLKLYVNGQLTEEKNTGFTFFNTSNNYKYKISNAGILSSSLFYSLSTTGSYTIQPAFLIGSGGLLNIDECRFWTETRTPEEIGQYWFTNVYGNDFFDTDNDKLLFYYKFNDGSETDEDICLDSSGYGYYGLINNFNAYTCRVSGSAINNSGLVGDVEIGDPILETSLQNSGTLKNFYDSMVLSGSDYDTLNIHALYKKFPTWVLEEEEENQDFHLKNIIQIISIYFDDLYNKIGELSKFKHIQNTQDSDKVYPFYDKILTSMGFDVTDLFSNVDAIEKISSRTETNLHDEEIKKVKNLIFQNIYNNLAFILKSKGTEKAIKSFLRVYGVNDDIVRVNLYADNSVYNATSKSKQIITKKKTLLLTGSNSVYLSGTTPQLKDYFTFENSLYFDSKYKPLTTSTSSLFGIYSISSSFDQHRWDKKIADFDVRVLNYSDGQVFGLYTGSVIVASSSKFTNIYDNTVWNLSLRLEPAVDSISTYAGGSSKYDSRIELYASNYNSINTASFGLSAPVTGTLTETNNYAFYLGSRKNSLTGSTLFETSLRSLYCNLWDNYLSNEVLDAHNKDITNYGVDQ